MKKKYLYAEFFILFSIFALPPIFASHPERTVLSFNFAVVPEAAAAIFLQVQFLSVFPQKKISSQKEKFSRLIKSLFYGAMTLGFLMLIFAATNAAAILTKKFPAEEKFVFADSPDFFYFVSLIFSLGAASFFEEEFYRQFLPEFLLYFFPSKKIFVFSAEFIALFSFALAHLYLGIFSVAYAFFCGMVLRFCRKKTGSIFTPWAVHFAYNLTLTIFSFLLENLQK